MTMEGFKDVGCLPLRKNKATKYFALVQLLENQQNKQIHGILLQS